MRKYIGLAIIATILGACSSETPEHRAALALDAQVDSALTAGDYALALELIDTLNTRYPLEIELRKASDAKRAKALEGAAITEIPKLDALIERTRAEHDSLRALFTEVRKSSALAPYLVYTPVSKSEVSASAGIQPRVNMGRDALDVPWTIAANAGRDIGLQTVTVECADGNSYTLAVTSPDGQMASITPETAAPLGQYLATEGASKAVKVVFTGSTGKTQAKLTPALSDAIAASWRLATVRQQQRSALVNRERYERRLQLARDAAANAPTPATPQ